MKDWTLRLLRRLTMGPAMRVSFGLSSLVVALLLAADLGFGLLPDQAAQLRQQRARTAENVALQAAMLMELAPPRALDRLLHELLVRETSVLSAAVRRDDGSIVAQAGDHAAVWIAAAGGVDRIDNISVPLKMNGSEWGAVELGFQRIGTLGWGRWLHDPVLLLVVRTEGAWWDPGGRKREACQARIERECPFPGRATGHVLVLRPGLPYRRLS